jgi:hypothetical protein
MNAYSRRDRVTWAAKDPRALFVWAVLLQFLVIWSRPAAADPMAYWYRLSEADRAEVQKTLTQRLPSLLPEEAQKYANTLATEIPRWGAFAGHLEQGEYAEMVGLYADDLAEYVGERFDELLPEEGIARSVFDLAKQHPESLKKVLQTAADPSKSWDDVRAVLWDEVNSNIQDYSKSQLESLVKTIVNEILGESKLGGYTPGDLYLLAVKSWTDAMLKFGPQVEAAAANQLYRQYRLARTEAGGNAAPAEEHVRDLWAADFVPGPDGRRLPASWSARLANMKLGVEDMLPLFAAYWTSSQGQGDRFHEWLEETSQRKLLFAQNRIREEARRALEEARDKAQAELRQHHATMARLLREAVEARLTDRERAARDEAIKQADTLVQQMRERNVALARQACAEFTATLAELEALDNQVRINRVSLSDLAFHIAEAKRVEQLGDVRGQWEAGLAALVAAIEKVQADAAHAEQESHETCNAAGLILSAANKEQGRQHLDAALAHARAARQAVAATEASIAAALGQRDQFLARLRSLDTQQRDVLREAQLHLQIVEAALADLQQRQALETRWNGIYARLTASARQHEAILGAFEVKAQRIDELLSEHNPNAAGDAIRREVEHLRGSMGCIRQNLETWAPAGRDGWIGRAFPRFETPDPQALREARALVAAYTQLATLPVVAELEAAAQAYQADIDAVRQRLGDAGFRADACAARAIVDFDRTWLTGDLTRVVVGGGSGDAGGADGAATGQPTPGTNQPTPADLAEGLGDAGSTTTPPSGGGVSLTDLASGLAGGSTGAGAAGGPRPDLSGLAEGLSNASPTVPPRGAGDNATSGARATGQTTTRSPTGVRRSPTRGPAPAANDEPLWAVYAVHPYPTAPPGANQAALNAWKARVTSERTFAPQAQPSGYIAFRVTGEVLQQYRAHQQAVAAAPAGADHPEFTLFRTGGHYYQLATQNMGNQRLDLPMFFTFFRLETAEPTWVRQSKVGLLPSQSINVGIQQMSAAASAGTWTATLGGQRVTFGKLQYSGQGGWDVVARRYGSQAMRIFVAIGEGIGEAIGGAVGGGIAPIR